MEMSMFPESSATLPPSVCKNNPPPPIPFVSKVKKMDKVDGPNADKSEWIKLEILMDPDIPDFKYSRQFAIFVNGFPEEWIN
jgi:hypothetical protein